jgi:peroxiredoxin
VITFAVVVVSGFMIFRLLRLNDQLRAKIPYLLPDEKIKYFNLVDKDAREIDSAVLSAPGTSKPSLIFIFSRPCSECNRNIYLWNKIAEIAKDKVNVYGIVLDSLGAAFEFEESANLNFKIFAPEDISKFQRSLRIILNFSMSILYHEGVKYMKLGDLQSDDAVEIIKLVKNLIKENKE